MHEEEKVLYFIFKLYVDLMEKMIAGNVRGINLKFLALNY